MMPAVSMVIAIVEIAHTAAVRESLGQRRASPTPTVVGNSPAWALVVTRAVLPPTEPSPVWLVLVVVVLVVVEVVVVEVY